MQTLSPKETQRAIKRIKDSFQINLAQKLNLTRVSAPLFVRPETGLNDNLSGVEQAVDFRLRNYGIDVEIVQSLAKWKRKALLDYGFCEGEGLYTDMNAIRPDEFLDETHSIYVDQWDWEKILRPDERTESYLLHTVSTIYSVFKDTQAMLHELYPNHVQQELPDEIFFVSAQELLDIYPDRTPSEREDEICREKKAVFILGVGDKLSSGEPHSLRSPDYDDWTLNGDIVFWSQTLNRALELSSMGIRVDAPTLELQLAKSKMQHRAHLPYHQAVLNNTLPQTIGGGIGQSRICMWFLQKRHIGEVQASVWDLATLKKCEREGIVLL